MMVGDIYDNFFLGMSILDLEKRRFYYEITKKPKFEYGYLRWAYVAKFEINLKIQHYNKRANSPETTHLINDQIVKLYQTLTYLCTSKYSQRLYQFIQNFWIEHYIKCHHFIISPASFNPSTMVFIVDSVIEARAAALHLTLPYFQKNLILGDRTFISDYYQVLKFLKDEETATVALKINQTVKDKFNRMALAACFDKGIGVIGKSELTALVIYRYLTSFFRFPVIGKFSEIAIEFNFDGGTANLANPTNFSGNLPDSPDSTRVFCNLRLCPYVIYVSLICSYHSIEWFGLVEYIGSILTIPEPNYLPIKTVQWNDNNQ